MKIKFLYIENGKIALTRQELERLLEESYQDGVAEGRKHNNSGTGDLAYPPSEIGTPDYYTTPYWGIDRAIPVTCNGLNIAKVSSATVDSLEWAETESAALVNDNHDSSLYYDREILDITCTANTASSVYATNTVDASLTETACLKGEN